MSGNCGIIRAREPLYGDFWLNMIDKPAVTSLHIQNLLSFGPDSPSIALGPLNVLIGPNGSGKSNLIEVIGLLNRTPEDLAEPFRETGGIDEWIWKGASKGSSAIIEVTANVPHSGNKLAFNFPSRKRPQDGHTNYVPLRYRLAFRPTNYQLEIVDERIDSDSAPKDSVSQPLAEAFFAYENGQPKLNVRGEWQTLRPDEINPQKSVLSQRKDPEQYPELTALGKLFSSFHFYRDWEFGIDTRAREASPADAPADFLEESVRNLALMLNQLNDKPDTEAQLLKYLKTFYADAESLKTTLVGGRVDIRLQERKRYSVSAARLSDGTLRWLALLTILLHPSPPPLVCLEEPELGLHPDVIPPLAELLRDASQRMQLIVTTHSDALVSELTDIPETVIVCEKENGSTTLKRLERKRLAAWLKTYSLGRLWRKGEIGGNRW